jgi:hypothetical protein
MDIDFILPSNSGTTNVKPASITNGAPAIASASGTDADSVRLDLRSLWAKFTSANNPPSTGVFVMGSNTAVALASMVNPLGQQSFPDMNMAGGTRSECRSVRSIRHQCRLVTAMTSISATRVAFRGREHEASIEMSDAPTGDLAHQRPRQRSRCSRPTGGHSCERTINWC